MQCVIHCVKGTDKFVYFIGCYRFKKNSYNLKKFSILDRGDVSLQINDA